MIFNYNIEFSTQLDSWEFNSTDILLNTIDVQDTIKKDKKLIGHFIIRIKNKVETIYQNSNSKTEFDLIDGSGVDLININKYTIVNHIISFRYHFSYFKNNIIA